MDFDFPRTTLSHFSSAVAAALAEMSALPIGPYILVGQVVIESFDLQRNPKAYKGLLEQVRLTEGRVRCLCTSPPREMSIKGSIYRRIHVSAFPYDSRNHDFCCAHYQDELSDGAGGSSRPAILKLEDGGLDVRLAVALVSHKGRKRSGGTGSPRRNRRASPEPSDRWVPRARRALSPLALLAAVFDAGGLQQWAGGSERTYAEWRERMLGAIRGMSVQGASLESHVHVPAAAPDAVDGSHSWNDFARRMARPAGGDVHRGIVVGEVEKFEAREEGYLLYLQHMPCPLRMTQKAHAKMERSFRRQMTADKHGEARRLVIAFIEINDRGEPEVGRIALAQSSRDYVLVESRYEAEVVNELVRLGRMFEKPIRPEAGLGFRPDIVLTDTPTRHTMEIFGFSGKRYQLQTERKKGEYARLGRAFWYWIPSSGARPPYPEPAM